MMAVTLPPELVHYILDSTLFSSNDLAHIALASRNFLSFARHNLYNHIEITIESSRIGVLAGDSRPGSVARQFRRPETLAAFRLKPDLHPFVNKISLHGNKFRDIGQASRITALKTVLDTFNAVETVVLDCWLWLSTKLSEMLVKYRNGRAEGLRLSVHFRTAYDYYYEDNGGFKVPLFSFDASRCADISDPAALAASKSSLRALGFHIRSRLGYQGFSNVTTLRISVFNFEGSDLVSEVLQIFEDFQHLKTLLLATNHYSCTQISALIHLLRHCVPVTLRRLSLEGDFGTDDVEKIVAALAAKSSLRRLTFRPIYKVPDITKAVAKVNAGRLTKGIQITVDECRPIWEDL